MPVKKKILCPTCRGFGEIDEPNNTMGAKSKRQSKIAHTLKKEGYSYREIAALMGYSSPHSVSVLLLKYKNGI
jgi:hypothetical protein